jgi:hypothetical protein
MLLIATEYGANLNTASERELLGKPKENKNAAASASLQRARV